MLSLVAKISQNQSGGKSGGNRGRCPVQGRRAGTLIWGFSPTFLLQDQSTLAPSLLRIPTLQQVGEAHRTASQVSAALVVLKIETSNRDEPLEHYVK